MTFSSGVTIMRQTRMSLKWSSNAFRHGGAVAIYLLTLMMRNGALDGAAFLKEA
jgi:hypothetical protein